MGVLQKAVPASKALRFFSIRPFVYFADLDLQLQSVGPHAVAIGTHSWTSVCFGSESEVEDGGVREPAWEEGCDRECLETWAFKKRAKRERECSETSWELGEDLKGFLSCLLTLKHLSFASYFYYKHFPHITCAVTLKRKKHCFC